MKIAVAQIMPATGDIRSNIETHGYFIKKAAESSSDAVFFPELSLTGYEPRLAQKLAIDPDDSILNPLRELSDKRNMTVAAGITLRAGSGVRIGMIIFQPFRERQIYSKMILHPDEIAYFTNGNEQILIDINDGTAAPAICYESLQPEHLQNAVHRGAGAYIVSAAKPQSGLDKAKSHYSLIAARYRIPVLLSNSTGYCDNFLSCGQSAVWDRHGKCLAQLNPVDEGLIVYNSQTEEIFVRIYN